MKLLLAGKRLILGFILLNIVDISTTYVLLDSGTGFEVNPIMRFMFSNFGFLGGLVLKGAVVIIACWFMYQYAVCGQEAKRGYVLTINFLLLLYVAALLNNASCLYTLWSYGYFT